MSTSDTASCTPFRHCSRVVDRTPFSWMYHSRPVRGSRSLRTTFANGTRRWNVTAGAFVTPFSGGSLVPSG
jgi:hypothetical protein